VAGEISRSTTIRTEESKKTHQVNGGEVEMWRDEPTPHWPEQLHEKKESLDVREGGGAAAAEEP
jgi:hypothetical protein